MDLEFRIGAMGCAKGANRGEGVKIRTTQGVLTQDSGPFERPIGVRPGCSNRSDAPGG